MTTLGVVVVTYNAKNVIRDCLETLLASGAKLKLVVVDNASTDGTLSVVQNWVDGSDGYSAPGDLPFAPRKLAKPVPGVTVIASGHNGGFAAGVNTGLRYLMADPLVTRFWILNPDTLVPPDTPSALLAAPAGFSLMGGRIQYAEPPYDIQIDAGTVNTWTGVTGNLNLGRPSDTALPNIKTAAFISGAHMVASRPFIEAAGLMPEHYFLYYEEVDWALRRGTLPLALCPSAPVFHHAGASIGSPTLKTTASAFSVYYKHRSRMLFLRRSYPWSLPSGYLYGLAKAGQALSRRQWPQAKAILRALHGLSLPADQ